MSASRDGAGGRKLGTIIPIRRLQDENDADFHRRACEEGDGWSHAFSFNYFGDGGAGLGSGGGDGRGGDAESQGGSDAEIRSILADDTDLTDAHYTPENWRRMGTHLAELPHLNCLNLREARLGEEGLAALFGPCVERGTCILNLYFYDCREKFRPGCLSAMMPFLRSQLRMEALNFSCTELGDEGVGMLSEALEHCRVDTLELSEVGMTDQGLLALLNAKNAIHIVELQLSRNHFSKPGFNALASFLQKEDGMLEYLQIDCTVTEWFIEIIESLPKESKLKAISGKRESRTAAVRRIMGAVHKFICDTATFESLCQSNHSLYTCNVLDKTLRNDDRQQTLALELNSRDLRPIPILHGKLRSFYFRGGGFRKPVNFDLAPFRNIGVGLMPRLLELLSWDDIRVDEQDFPLTNARYCTAVGRNLNGMYRLVRNLNTAELFGFPSQAISLTSKVSWLEEDNKKLKEEIEELREERARMMERVRQLTAQNHEARSSDNYTPNKRVRTDGRGRGNI